MRTTNRTSGTHHRWSTIAIMLGIAVVTAGGPLVTEPAGASVEPLVIRDANETQMAQVTDALGRFEAAGLDLPPLDITFHEAAGGCNGHPGFYQRRNGIAHIDICVPSNHVIIHELAHAWEGANVSDHARSRFADSWGFDNWNDHSAPWNQRAIERAADTVAFVLEGLPSEPTDSLLRFICGYELLTGNPLPEEGQDHCDGS